MKLFKNVYHNVSDMGTLTSTSGSVTATEQHSLSKDVVKQGDITALAVESLG